jgi:hypothetical protein
MCDRRSLKLIEFFIPFLPIVITDVQMHQIGANPIDRVTPGPLILQL